MQKKVVAGIVVAAMVACVALAALLAGRTGNMASPGARGNIGVINIDGMITTGASVSPLFGDVTSGSGTINQLLRQAAEDPQLKAVILRLNSPGGTVAGTQEIAVEVDRLRRAGKKVVASMGDMAASGAYWVAARCDLIVANPGTTTGSIGVIMQLANLEGLYEKLGIENYTFKKGEYKDIGSSTRDVTAEEKRILQEMLDEHYEMFVRTVAEGRNLSSDEVEKAATGQIFTGTQAKELGLVDKLGNFYDAVDAAAELAGIRGEPVVVNLAPEKDWLDFFTIRSRPAGNESLFDLIKMYPTAWAVYLPGLEAGVTGLD